MKLPAVLRTTALTLSLIGFAGVATAEEEPPGTENAGKKPVNVAPDQLAERFGIKVEALRLSAAGHLLDLRYRITDKGKAKALMEQWKPFLVDEASGRRLSTPSFAKVGALRQSPERLEEGRIYFVLFANPGRALGHDDQVTVALDRVRVEGVAIE